jgi:hypothetical protein
MLLKKQKIGNDDDWNVQSDIKGDKVVGQEVKVEAPPKVAEEIVKEVAVVDKEAQEI